MRKSLTLAALAIAFGAATPALAAGIVGDANAGLQHMRDFNLIVLGNLTTSQEVEGRTYVGGNLDSNGGFTAFLRGDAAQRAQGPGLIVGGNISGSNVQLNNQSGAKVGGNITASTTPNGLQTISVGGSAPGMMNLNGSTLNQGVPGLAGELALTTAQYSADFKALSAALAGLTSGGNVATDTAVVANNAISFTPSQANASIATFSLSDLSQINSVSRIDFNSNGADFIVVNVGGTDLTLSSGVNFNGPSGLGTNVIWNFYEATSIDFASQSWYGSVLAPYASASTGNFIEGTAIFANLTANGEIHLANFDGDFQLPPPPSAVPEPATWLTMILGFGLVGIAVRRLRMTRVTA